MDDAIELLTKLMERTRKETWVRPDVHHGVLSGIRMSIGVLKKAKENPSETTEC